MRRPEPTDLIRAIEKLPERVEVGCFTPVRCDGFERKSKARTMIDQAPAKFAINQNQAGLAQQGQLGGDHVIRERAGTGQYLDVAGARESAELLFGRPQI